MQITPANWTEFQHYKDRSPQWIKLHRKLLDDYEFNQMPIESRALAPMLWLLASDYSMGIVDKPVDAISFRMRMSKADAIQAIQPLIIYGFFLADSEFCEDCELSIGYASIIDGEKPEKWASRYVPDKTRAKIIDASGGKCSICGSAENLEIDHILPISKGGDSDESNLQCLCRSCNRRKRTSVATATQENNPCSLEKRREETEKEKRQRKTVVESDKPTRPAAEKKSDSEWLSDLQTNTAYEGIDISREVSKCQAWCDANGKTNSRKRIINWLNRIDKPVKGIRPAGRPVTFEQQRIDNTKQAMVDFVQEAPNGRLDREPETVRITHG